MLTLLFAVSSIWDSPRCWCCWSCCTNTSTSTSYYTTCWSWSGKDALVLLVVSWFFSIMVDVTMIIGKLVILLGRWKFLMQQEKKDKRRLWCIGWLQLSVTQQRYLLIIHVNMNNHTDMCWRKNKKCGEPRADKSWVWCTEGCWKNKGCRDEGWQ